MFWFCFVFFQLFKVLDDYISFLSNDSLPPSLLLAIRVFSSHILKLLASAGMDVGLFSACHTHDPVCHVLHCLLAKILTSKNSR